jgi:glycosyltransferase involved in cell wall biosynthesis
LVAVGDAPAARRVLAVGNLYPPAANGGYERTWRAAMRRLAERGHATRVLTTAPVPGAEVRAEEPAETAVFRELRWYWRDYEFPPLSPPRRLALERHNEQVLARHLRDFAPDVVTWWGMGGMSLSLVEQVRRAGIPAVGLVGDAWMTYGFQVDAWLRMWRARPRAAALADRALGIPTRVDLSGAATWLFNSEYTRSLAGEALARTGVVHPGVDPAAFPERPPGPWAWRLACVGRIEATKGLATAIEALAELPAEATLSIVGTGDERHRAELEALAARLGIAERVAFGSAPPEAVADRYAEADAVLFPVVWDEPWGLVPLEAMSVGRPVVATATGGAREYLRDEENCLLIERGAAGPLARQVRRLAESEALRDRLRAGGRATARRFTEDAFLAAVVAAVEEEAARVSA